MMKTIFIAPAEVRSPRWQQAFPDADVVDYEASLPADLAGHLLWVVMGDLQLREKLPRWVSAGARVVALTQTEDAAEAKQMLEWGASGYLHYLAAVPVLEQVRQVVQMGGLWLGVDLMRQLVFATASILQVPEVAPRQPLLEALTARERAVADAVAAGKTNKEVARALDITERTVKAHLGAVFEKLNVRDRLQLVLVMAGK
jgi:DNA-binding NarL/FixJ family response regulator